MLKTLTSLFTDSNDKALKRFRPFVEHGNELEPQAERLSDEELRATRETFRRRLEEGEGLDDILPDVFARVREAARRGIGQRHFDVQLLGGIALHQGKIAEMKTGEGKTLVATLAASLNAVTGKGVHIVTVNDYLAKRDTVWMGPIFHMLGLSVACLQHEASFMYDPTVEGEGPSTGHLRPVSRRDAYLADITYGTNHEFGFDYLRDNLALDLSQTVQRELYYAIVDEVDNILIDEARTPLIISGPAQESTRQYVTVAQLAPRMKETEDFTLDEKQRAVSLTDVGIGKMEKWLNVGNLYDPGNYILTHYIENALRALVVYKRDRDYVVKDSEVVIVDEFTGRLMPGRRWSDGLHQAIEAKEGVKIQQESITYATVTLQNYFRMYKKLAGMTGTAATEAEEFWKIYKLEVVAIPTHKTMIRKDSSDFVYKTEEAKWRAAAKEIEELHRREQPVLVGTTSIEKSERLSDLLRRRGVPHQVLNAKYHEREAAIVAQAGRLGAITVATNMAGRGTDIILGGNPERILTDRLSKDGSASSASPEAQEALRKEVMAQWEEEHRQVVAAGGLHVLGTERHEARRIDNQLRGRSGRQGDPGSSRFYTSLEDDLMRRFGGDRIKTFMNWAGLPDDQPIENAMVTKAIEGAQVKVEAHNFEMRKHLVEYDDVVNRHREVIYQERHKILSGADLKTNILGMIEAELKETLARFLPGDDADRWELDGLIQELRTVFPLPEHLQKASLKSMAREEVDNSLLTHSRELYEQRERDIGPDNMRVLERLVMLRTIDSHWVEHLTAVENTRQGIGLQAYGQRDPLVEFKSEGHRMFQDLLARIQHDIVHTIYHVSLMVNKSPEAPAERVKASPMAAVARPRQVASAASTKVGRNDPCPCGSGKKYKRCHGAAA
ncbi:MAG: preprotein translocase subunit SecA [Chloroflexi bacterium]|nr:preprotein translocase subunit SecA [Chloroflexota bacterium]